MGASHHYNVSRDDIGDALTANFSPRGEAKDFIRLVFSGRMTVEEAKESILMTPTQLRGLVENKIGWPGELRRISWKRQIAWEAFKRMYR